MKAVAGPIPNWVAIIGLCLAAAGPSFGMAESAKTVSVKDHARQKFDSKSLWRHLRRLIIAHDGAVTADQLEREFGVSLMVGARTESDVTYYVNNFDYGVVIALYVVPKYSEELARIGNGFPQTWLSIYISPEYYSDSAQKRLKLAWDEKNPNQCLQMKEIYSDLKSSGWGDEYVPPPELERGRIQESISKIGKFARSENNAGDLLADVDIDHGSYCVGRLRVQGYLG